jgi:hypothetical protein
MKINAEHIWKTRALDWNIYAYLFLVSEIWEILGVRASCGQRIVGRYYIPIERSYVEIFPTNYSHVYVVVSKFSCKFYFIRVQILQARHFINFTVRNWEKIKFGFAPIQLRRFWAAISYIV